MVSFEARRWPRHQAEASEQRADLVAEVLEHQEHADDDDQHLG
ncbi:hypothetical protein [Pseudenhygromyxa sp. WMMC2535]|nr:hypothetical protein [Pseudenhygromyxa sp. WMMC2535]